MIGWRHLHTTPSSWFVSIVSLVFLSLLFLFFPHTGQKYELQVSAISGVKMCNICFPSTTSHLNCTKQIICDLSWYCTAPSSYMKDVSWWELILCHMNSKRVLQEFWNMSQNTPKLGIQSHIAHSEHEPHNVDEGIDIPHFQVVLSLVFHIRVFPGDTMCNISPQWKMLYKCN